MNRRYFLAAAGAAVISIMAGCGQSKSKFVGYWKDPDEAKFPALLHIRPNGDSFFLTWSTWEGPKKGYEAKEFPATLGASKNVLSINVNSFNTVNITYEEATDQLLVFVSGEKGGAERISKNDYQAALDRGKAEYEREKTKQKEIQKDQ